MNPPGPGAWQRTSPVAIVFFVGKSAKWVYDRYGMFGQVVAAIGVTAFLLRNPQYTVLAALTALLTVALVGGLQYWFFRFRIDDDRILIRQGVVNRAAVDLPFDRIQGINVNRRPIERVLGLVTVVLDTPGSISAEGQLPTVDPEIAEQLLAKVAEHQADGPEGGAGTAHDLDAAERDRTAGESQGPATGARLDAARARGEVLQELASRDLFRMGLVSRGFVLYGLLLLVVARQVDVATDAALGAFGAVRDVLGGLGAFAAAVAVAALALGLLVLVVATRVGSAFVRHYGYTLWREGRSYRSRAGLFTRKEAAVRIPKVQQLRVYQGAVYRIFGRHRLALPPIGGSLDADDDDDERTRETVDVDTLGVPWADSALVERIRSGVFRGEGERLAALPDDEAFTRVSRLYIRAAALRFLFVGVPAGIFLLFILSDMVAASWRGEDVDRSVLFMHQLQGWGAASAIWAALSVVLAAPVGWLRWRATAYMHDDDGLSCRTGLIGYSVEAFLFRKAQGVTVTQSPLQRRHGLATLEVETACGSVTVPYIEHALVCALRDLIVYKVESSRRRWY